MPVFSPQCPKRAPERAGHPRECTGNGKAYQTRKLREFESLTRHPSECRQTLQKTRTTLSGPGFLLSPCLSPPPLPLKGHAFSEMGSLLRQNRHDLAETMCFERKKRGRGAREQGGRGARGQRLALGAAAKLGRPLLLERREPLAVVRGVAERCLRLVLGGHRLPQPDAPVAQLADECL